MATPGSSPITAPRAPPSPSSKKGSRPLENALSKEESENPTIIQKSNKKFKETNKDLKIIREIDFKKPIENDNKT
ncbi:hypothetical protein H5410_060699 [Solanum commersonii]|uniref:Uncharacterized protein n=1 Tax=Solanum commersonii TaxID=4109 RepID=A0A9J5W5S6_SOLCO|nr:hypothetical protein H5410_060699 [Solanum commersonii]